jgi:hypothetical protein
MSTLLMAFTQVALFAAGLVGPWRNTPARETRGRLPVQARMLLSFSLVVAAWLIFLGHLGKVPVYAQWIALGMSASFIGDLVMARIIPLPNRLIGGMVAFGIAHGFYITAYNGTIQTISSLEPYARFNTGLTIGLIVYGVITLAGWWFLIRNPQKGVVINIGALAYGLWISVMASFALALANGLGFWLAALGGLLFVSSDLIIGMTDIRGIQLKNANDWVWLTYVAGQMGIIYANALVA